MQFSADKLGAYQKMARGLRAEGIGVEVYPEAKKPGPQFKYADQRGFKLALIAGPECPHGERISNPCQDVSNHRSRTSCLGSCPRNSTTLALFSTAICDRTQKP